MLVFCAGIPLGDSMMRILRTSGISASQALFMEHGSIALLLLPFVWRRLKGLLTTGSLRWQFIRAMGFSLAAIIWIFVIPFVPLSQLFAIGFLAPILAAIISVWLLDERMTVHRLLSLVVGFVGAMIVVRPISSGVSVYLLFALLSPLCWAFMVIGTKRLSQSYSHLDLLFLSTGSLALMCLPNAVLNWQPVQAQYYVFLPSIVLIGMVVHGSYILAYKFAPLTRLLPLEFLSLIFATTYGYLFFKEQIDVWTFVGGVIIFISGLYISLRREQPGGIVPSPMDV